MSTPSSIRHLFLNPQPTYSPADAAALLGTSVAELRGWMDGGEIEGVETQTGVVVPWEELVSFGLEYWSQEAVESALGADVAKVIPELLRLTELVVRIPRIQVITLERLAAVDGGSVSAVLAREQRDLVSVHAEWLSQTVPEFAVALAWPDNGAGVSDRERTPLWLSGTGVSGPVR